MKVYEALYCSCTWESSYATISIHLSKEGAEKAIAWDKMLQLKEWKESHTDLEFPDDRDWTIKETDVLP